MGQNASLSFFLFLNECVILCFEQVIIRLFCHIYVYCETSKLIPLLHGKLFCNVSG